MRLSRAGTGQGSLDHDVQRDGSRPLGRLGRTRRVEQHGYGLGQRVGVGVLMVEVVGVDVLAGRRGWDVSWEGRGGRWGRELKAHGEAAVVVQRERGGDDGMA